MKNNSEEYDFEYSSSTEYFYDNITTFEPVTICNHERLHMFVSSYVPTVHLILFCLSLIGNTVILVILAKWEKLNSVTNIFILNLVISDLIFTVTFPFTTVALISHWVFGEIMCKMVTAFFFTGFQSFVIFITLMTIDQYLIIVHSWSSTSSQKVRYAQMISVFAWVTSIIFSVPDIIIYTSIDESLDLPDCSVSSHGLAKWLTVGHYKHFVLFFLLPLLIVIVCYFGIAVKIITSNIRRRDRVLKLIFFIVLFFFVCWSPYNIIMFLMFMEHTESFNDCNSLLHYMFYVSQTILYLHCCINPFLYAIFGTKFRRHIICSCRRNCEQRQTSQQQDISLRTSFVPGF
ncbi:C-C chemokine receptor type 8-like [Pelobates fuscus]|uniref:C-C chemokine receptor type 8-like n=1 Tax=Pelobates fuscus TaxID=191477 RepID=UPI002FE477F4